MRLAKCARAAMLVAAVIPLVTGCDQGTSALSVKCSSSAAAREVTDEAVIDPGASPRPVPARPHLAAAESLPASSSARRSELYTDPGDARYMYELGPLGISKVDAATWKPQERA